MKKIISLLLTAVMLVSVMGVSASALRNGDVVNYVLYTDIVTYINGYPIQSYNIDGYTAVIVEDLDNYGFDVSWNSIRRTLSLAQNPNKRVNPTYRVTPNTHKIGSRAMDVLYTDIVTYLSGVKVNSYNVNGRTIVYVDDLAKYYAKSYKWSEGTRTLSLTLNGTPSVIVPDPPTPLPKPDYTWDFDYSQRDYKVDTMYYGFTYTFKNDGRGGFDCTSSDGSVKAVEHISLNANSVGFSIYQGITNVIGNTLSDLDKNINIDPTGTHKTVSDTPSQRSRLSKLFSVKINGSTVTGKLEFGAGNGHTDYTLYFDDYYQYKDVKKITVTVGDIKKQSDTVTVTDAMNEKLTTNYFITDTTGLGYVKTYENSWRLPKIDSQMKGAQGVNSLILSDFNTYSFLGGSRCADVYNALKSSGGTVYASSSPDFTYYRTIDYTSETNGTVTKIYVNYVTYPFDGGKFTDTVGYSYDSKDDSFKYLGMTNTNYITELRALGDIGLAASDVRYKFVTAFINGDTATLERLAGVAAGTYDDYKTIKISNFAVTSASDKNGTRIQLLFNVSQSTSKTFPVGRYNRYVIDDPKTGTYLSGMDVTQTSSEARTTLDKWLANSTDFMIYDNSKLDTAQKTIYQRNVFDYIISTYGSLSKVDITYLASALFNISDFVPAGTPDRFTGNYSTKTHSGDKWAYTVTSEVGSAFTTTLNVQFYADFSKTIASHTVQYVLTYTSYGYSFVSASITNSSTTPPIHYTNA